MKNIGLKEVTQNYLQAHFLGEKSPYEERKQFLSILYRLTQEGRIKLAFDGKFLEGTIEEQVQLYSDR